MLKDYFFARVVEAVGKDKAGGHFVAVTDPGSALEKTAKADRFRRVSLGQPNIGGRYSVLSPFGLVPAAAAGIDIARLLETAQAMVRSCGDDVPPADNPAVQLGIALGVAGREGRDKVTLFCSPKLVDFGAWAEQLIAELTGKNGKGLIPIDAEPLGAPDLYGSDRFFIDLRTTSEADPARDGALDALQRAGHPLARIELKSPEYIGQEFFRFELAIAVAGAVIGINPFDQPDVEASKAKTRELTAAFEKTGALPGETPVAREGAIEVYTDAANAEGLKKAGADGGVESWLKAHFARLHPGDYAALLAYAEGFDILKNAGSEALPEAQRFDLNIADIAEVWRRRECHHLLAARPDRLRPRRRSSVCCLFRVRSGFKRGPVDDSRGRSTRHSTPG